MEPVVISTPKKTRRGNIFSSIKQHYLRHDVPCGYSSCIHCSNLMHAPLSDTNLYFFDLEALISHITVLEEQYQCPVLTNTNTLFLQSTLLELKVKDQNLYKRVKTFIDENHFHVFLNEHRAETYIPQGTKDREYLSAIKAAEWLSSHLPQVEIKVISLRSGERCIKLEEIVKNTILADMFPVDEPAMNPIFSEHINPIQAEKMIKEGSLFEGVLHVYRNSPDSAWIRVTRNVGQSFDVAIKGIENMNRSIDGDVVAIEVLNEPMDIEEKLDHLEEVEGVDVVNIKVANVEEKPHREGRVVSILRNKQKSYCGSIRRTGVFIDNREQCLFSPVNPKLPEIKIYCANPSRLEGMRITVSIDKWDISSNLPQGHVVKILGEIEDVKTESDVILLEHDVVIKPFTQAALNCLPPRDWVLTQEEIDRRTDLRDRCVASVDPPGCKDIDDALHCKVLPNGNLEVGVHIADVTHFVLPESALDLEASERCTTVYLVERRTDMLPGILTEVLCSLVCNQDRLAFSVLWELDPKTYEIKKTTFCKSLIHSRASLSYQKAQEIIDSNVNDEMAFSLRKLLDISKHLKRQRIVAGALELASAEVKFELDTDKLKAKDMALYKTFETNSMVEEFMLLANIAVADKICEAYPAYSILRRHPSPKLDDLKKLAEKLEYLGYPLNYDSSLTLAESLNRIIRQNDPYFNTIIRMQVTRCMNQAVYFCSSEVDRHEYYHYGLAAEIYTHFTSPIRRYADILVHRLLAAAIDVKSLPEKMTDRREMGKICRRMNFRNRMSQYSERTSANLHTYLVFKGRKDVIEYDAIVTEILPNGVDVMIPKIGLEGEVELPNASEYDSRSIVVENQKISLYDHIAVHVDITFQNFRKTINLQFIRKS
ncbi:unnamed protein product [Blepharisma stoltei]|uniref:RNB domain-containing protein n=1 Tax=Blepharisma stoltei TaxID=1481888 RepID=A0AAU9J484_9CILI|nr:unnamed protein product [Blepharisma stoltei]